MLDVDAVDGDVGEEDGGVGDVGDEAGGVEVGFDSEAVFRVGDGRVGEVDVGYGVGGFAADGADGEAVRAWGWVDGDG